jgi:hypothetical protein
MTGQSIAHYKITAKLHRGIFTMAYRVILLHDGTQGRQR